MIHCSHFWRVLKVWPIMPKQQQPLECFLIGFITPALCGIRSLHSLAHYSAVQSQMFARISNYFSAPFREAKHWTLDEAFFMQSYSCKTFYHNLFWYVSLLLFCHYSLHLLYGVLGWTFYVCWGFHNYWCLLFICMGWFIYFEWDCTEYCELPGYLKRLDRQGSLAEHKMLKYSSLCFTSRDSLKIAFVCGERLTFSVINQTWLCVRMLGWLKYCN